MSLRTHAPVTLGGLLCCLLAACGPEEVALSLAGPSSATVFADREIDVPLALEWVGEARAVTVTGGSGTGLTVVSQQVAPGTTTAQVRIVAAETASSGEVTLTAAGEGVSTTWAMAVTVARAAVVSVSDEPALRGGYVDAVVSVSGGEPSFEGVEEAKALGDGRWRLRFALPEDAPLGADERHANVQVGGVTEGVSVVATVTNEVRVVLIDRSGTPVSGVEVAVDGTWKLSDAQGRVSFAGVKAPYRLDVRGTESADSYQGVRRARPTARLSILSEPMRSQEVEVTVKSRATNAPITGGSKSIYFNFDGVHGWSFGIPTGMSSTENTVRWYSNQTTVNGRARLVMYEDGQVAGLAEDIVSFNSTDPSQYLLTLRVEAVPLGEIQTRMTLPEGFSFSARWATAVFAGNRWDRLTLGSTGSKNAEAAIPGVLLREDVRHDVAAHAFDLAGRLILGQWYGVRPGDTIEAELIGPPLLPLPPTIGDAHEYQLEGPEWPVYRLTLNVGAGDARLSENVYSRARVLRRSGVFLMPSSAPASVSLCGLGDEEDVDTLLDGAIWSKPGLKACERNQELDWQNP